MMHGGIFAISALWLAKRHNNWSFMAHFKHRMHQKNNQSPRLAAQAV
jgi:hypothetical protein